MRVRDVMRKQPRVCAPEDTVATAGRIMAEVDCGVLPVMQATDELVGILTDRDVALAVARTDVRPSELTVEQVMTRKVASCCGADDLRSAMATMRERRVRRLPVLGEKGVLEGILSLDDVVLEAKAVAGEQFTGPFYVDVAETLKAINRHQVPAAPAH